MFGPLVQPNWFEPGAASYIAYNWEAFRASHQPRTTPPLHLHFAKEDLLGRGLMSTVSGPIAPLPPLPPITIHSTGEKPQLPERLLGRKKEETKSAFQEVRSSKRGNLTSSAPSKGVWRPY